MSSLGLYLRELRQRQGLNIEDVSRATRVATRYLEALETDDLASLPAPVFARGFLRAYCHAVKVAPDEVLALYHRQVGTTPRSMTPPATAERRVDPRTASRGTVLVSFVLLVVLGLALFVVTLLRQPGREMAQPDGSGMAAVAPPAVADPLTPVSTLEDSAGPLATGLPEAPPASDPGGTAESPATIDLGSSPYRLVARVSEPTWIRVWTEDGRFTEETIPGGEVREWVSATPFVVTVGNAGGITLELNGRPLPSLGPRGAVVSRLVIPPPQR
jgi:cytoskeleton protein RodZ